MFPVLYNKIPGVKYHIWSFSRPNLIKRTVDTSLFIDFSAIDGPCKFPQNTNFILTWM